MPRDPHSPGIYAEGRSSLGINRVATRVTQTSSADLSLQDLHSLASSSRITMTSVLCPLWTLDLETNSEHKDQQIQVLYTILAGKRQSLTLNDDKSKLLAFTCRISHIEADEFSLPFTKRSRSNRYYCQTVQTVASLPTVHTESDGFLPDKACRTFKLRPDVSCTAWRRETSGKVFHSSDFCPWQEILQNNTKSRVQLS